MKGRKKVLFRGFAAGLALALLCAGCGKGPGEPTPTAGEATPAPSAAPAPTPALAPTPAPDRDGDRERRGALLTALSSMCAEDAMYARLCDLNGDGVEDVLTLGRYTFMGDTDWGYSGFCFQGLIWDGEEVRTVPLDGAWFLQGFGSNRYAVYREWSTGTYYVGYDFAMDETVAWSFQSGNEEIPMEYTYDYETEEGRAEGERRRRAIQAEIDERFQLVETVRFPDRTVNGYPLSEDFCWMEYWSGSDAERPELPPFYSTVGEVRYALSELSQGADPAVTLPFAPGTLSLWFSSGVGNWWTSLELREDGTFEGTYLDGNLGEIGPDYPEGTCYVAGFTGRFTGIRQVDAHTWTMYLQEVTTEKEPGETWLADGRRYIATEPYGVAEGEEFLLFTPESPTGNLPEGFLSWREWEPMGSVLGRFGVYNVAQGQGFFS